ncbi:MAG: phosphoribosylformylglycinamidine synthase subunit PurS [Synergistaceae bacterium]|jgi:phosphoribosylformylglycinamidine synthase|nr:phosphoribosylformylglycinamidine synthase subunit PurS [Synergistaceae bacterium]
MPYQAKVTVMFRKSILDPQGAAVERALKAHSEGIDISSVRVGKVIELMVDGPGPDIVEEKVKVLADRILANPVMEEYTVQVESLS